MKNNTCLNFGIDDRNSKKLFKILKVYEFAYRMIFQISTNLGGFPIEIETKISKLITNSLAIFIIQK